MHRDRDFAITVATCHQLPAINHLTEDFDLLTQLQQITDALSRQILIFWLHYLDFHQLGVASNATCRVKRCCVCCQESVPPQAVTASGRSTCFQICANDRHAQHLVHHLAVAPIAPGGLHKIGL